jgi:putative ABC transport system permease protein
VVQPAYRRGDSFQVVFAKLESPDAFDRFRRALTSDPRLDLKVLRESEY